MPPVRGSLVIFAAAALLVSCGSATRRQHGPHQARKATATVSVSVTACGAGWTATKAGHQHLTVHNVDSRPGEAQLVRPKTGAIFVDVEPLGPGTTTTVDLNLAAGRYAWRCLMEDEPAVLGRARTLTGHTAGTPTPGVRPVTQADLIPATQAYERYVSGQLPRLAGLVSRLRTDLIQNNLSKARHDWLSGHLQYERLGAAYDAFGDLDGAINGLPNGLPKGVHDQGWTGFHRIEYGLWHGQPTSRLVPLATTLANDVKRLRHQFATAEIDPAQIAIRAHEIAENALQFELTGRTNFGSNTQLETVAANLHGTAQVLTIVHKLIAPRYPKLKATTTKVRTALRDLDHHASHERVDADISQLCELLAPIASILEPRKTR